MVLKTIGEIRESSSLSTSTYFLKRLESKGNIDIIRHMDKGVKNLGMYFVRFIVPRTQLENSIIVYAADKTEARDFFYEICPDINEIIKIIPA